MRRMFARFLIVMVVGVFCGSVVAEGSQQYGVRRPEYQWSPLHWAVRYNDMDTARSLATGRNLEARDVLGRTPLHIAAMFGLADMVDLLLARGSDVNARDQWGVTPLFRVELVTRYREWDLSAVAGKLQAAGGVKMDMRGLRE
jgi:hypothetical protein